jgi:FtsP/CotA-like multicopper oxidase with cupredoxin domain
VNGKGGANLAAWGYSDTSGGTPKFPGPALIASPGEVVNVTVFNDHSIAHNFVIDGLTTDLAPIAPGDKKTYTFTATDSKAGSHVYYDSLNNSVNREMGLYGAAIIKPASQTVWTNGPAYTFERTWVIGEMDKASWNDLAGIGQAVDTTAYQPNYYLINGMGGIDAVNDNVNTSITGKVGDIALVRIVNAGQLPYSLHFHANHVQVAAVNGVRQSSPFVQLDTVVVPPLKSVDLLYTLNQSGDYLMHVQTTQAESSAGVYLNGIMAMAHIQ